MKLYCDGSLTDIMLNVISVTDQTMPCLDVIKCMGSQKTFFRLIICKLIINVVTYYRLLIPKGTRQLVDLNYGVGVRLEPGYCSIEWKQASGDPFSFTVSGDTGGVVPGEYGAQLFASND
jgi:hypothetical protein